MKITSITVHAGRTFNHPHEDYSNLRPSIQLTAQLEDGDDPQQVAKDLQSRAEGLVEDHKQQMLKSLEELHQLGERRAELLGLEKTIRSAQERLDEVRRQHPDLKLLPGS